MLFYLLSYHITDTHHVKIIFWSVLSLLYKVDQISETEMRMNLTILFAGNNFNSIIPSDFLTEDNMLLAFNRTHSTDDTAKLVL